MDTEVLSVLDVMKEHDSELLTGFLLMYANACLHGNRAFLVERLLTLCDELSALANGGLA